MFRATWEGSAYEPSGAGQGDADRPTEDSNAPAPEYGQAPEQYPPPGPPGGEYESGGSQRDYGQQRSGYRPTYGEYPPDRPDNSYGRSGDSYSPGPGNDYHDNYNPSDSYHGSSRFVSYYLFFLIHFYTLIKFNLFLIKE